MDLKRIIRFGLLAGVSMAFLGSIGMVESFNHRTLINPFLRMGDMFLYGTLLTVAYFAARGEYNILSEDRVDKGTGAMSGAGVGLVAAVFLSLFLIVVDNVDLTEFFPNMDQSMVESLTFGQGIPMGLLLMAGASLAVGALGGLLPALSTETRKSIWLMSGWIISFALLEIVFIDIVENRTVIRLVYSPNGGLRAWVAAVIGVLVFFVSRRYEGRFGTFTTRVKESDAKSRLRRGIIALAVFAAIVLPMLLGGILNELLINVSLFILMGLGLNIVVGLAGLLDLGYVAFFAVGAYGTAVLTSPLSPTVTLELNWWFALPIVMVIAAIAGLLVGTPVIRMRGDYLAIVTLGFGEIVRILLLSDWLTPLFGGSQGIRRIPGVPVPFLGEVGGTRPELFVYLTTIFVLIAAYISYRAQNSRVGRSWAAMREDEDVAEAIGISTVQAKLLAFVTGAIVASFAGALFAAKVGAVFTNSFDVLVSIVILVVVIVGGMGSIPGVVVGAFVLIGVLGGPKSPGLLQEFAEYKLLFYGAILVVMMLNKPEGLVPSVRRSRELHQDEMSQDAWLDRAGGFKEDEHQAQGTTS
ncbi:MAG TPA: leucine/isoleucine/valine transporter permease subunit [Acidimicrobiia bacterium]|nr:leucine/isoleucine/valine transporter permease subunit [Acidimicrobiia bacterium]